jgi:hypothetical protein
MGHQLLSKVDDVIVLEYNTDTAKKNIDTLTGDSKEASLEEQGN